jgi:hypothetical protein
MFSAKTISDRICGLIYIATFANIIHLNLNRPTKIAVCAPGLSNQKMSNFHFDLLLKLPQGEVHDFSGEVQKFSGIEVQDDLRRGAHLSTHPLKIGP